MIKDNYQETEPDDEVILYTWYKKTAYAFFLGFFCPIYLAGFMGNSLFFPNIQFLGNGGFFANLVLLYPLIAGIVILIILRTGNSMVRAVSLLLLGLIPVISLPFFKEDFFAYLAQETFKSSFIFYLLFLSLTGMVVGAKTVIKHNSSIGRILGGISGILFTILIFIPVKSGLPLYFSFFELLKGPFLMIFFGVCLIIAFSIFLYSAYKSVMNIKDNPKSKQTAEKIKKMIKLTTLSLLVLFFFNSLFSRGGGTTKAAALSVLIKLFLLSGGLISLIYHGFWDLIDQLHPQTFSGGELMNRKSY